MTGWPRQSDFEKLAERCYEAALEQPEYAEWPVAPDPRYADWVADLAAELSGAFEDRWQDWRDARKAGLPLGVTPPLDPHAVALERDPPLDVAYAVEAPRGGRDALCLAHGRRRCAECWG